MTHAAHGEDRGAGGQDGSCNTAAVLHLELDVIDGSGQSVKPCPPDTAYGSKVL